MNRAIFVGTLIFGTTAIGTSVFALSRPQPSRQSTWSILPATQQESGGGFASRAGGASPNLNAAIVPESVSAQGAGESITYHVDIASGLKEDAAIAWTALVVDDHGRQVATLSAGQTPIAPASVQSTPSFTPSLPDGFYALRVRAAVHSTHWEEATEAVQYLAVVGGKTREMSFEDWYSQSDVGLATQVNVAGGTP